MRKIRVLKNHDNFQVKDDAEIVGKVLMLDDGAAQYYVDGGYAEFVQDEPVAAKVDPPLAKAPAAVKVAKKK